MPTSPCSLQDLLVHLPRCRRSAGASSVPPRPRLSKRCQSEEVEFMTSATVKRVFEVDAPLEEAWRRLAEVERWAEWAPHITSVTVSPPAHIKRCLAGQAAGAQHLPHVGMGAASALGVGRRAAWGPHLLRPSVRVVGPGIDTAGMVGRAPWAPGAAHSTCLRPSVRSQSRQGDPQTAGVVSPLMAGNVGAPPCGVRRGWSANWS